MSANPFRWVEIYVQDMSKAVKFYEEVFGLKLEKLPNTNHEMYAFPMAGDKVGAGGALIHMPGVPSGGGGVLPYFASVDCTTEVNRAKKAGGQIKAEKFSIGEYGFVAHIIDPDGNMIGVHSME